MFKRIAATQFLLFAFFSVFAQQKIDNGLLTGNVVDEKNQPLEKATLRLIPLADRREIKTALTDKTGSFEFTRIPFGFYRLTISYAGLQQLSLDSIYFRQERTDFNLSNLVLKQADNTLETVVLYVEKPLIESKEGNIIFNASESALAAGSTASELLESVPLVAKDADGKVTVRGKEPKILIDDKPVELNLQQLQELLESMPGSTIEKIEVMTNPPPQYANEEGGVINIVTKKGKAGVSGRIALTAGTRGEAGINGSFNYRKQDFSLTINASASDNRYEGNGYSIRNNIYKDSSNFFNTTNNYINKNFRPNFRANMNYDIDKKNSFSLVFNFNANSYDNEALTEYRNINRFDELWRLSQRTVNSSGDNYTPNLTVSYTLKSRPGETFRVIAGYNYSSNYNDRDFYQQYFNPDETPNGIDSVQEQLNDTRINSYNVRVSYDKMLNNQKTFLSFGGFYNKSNNHAVIDASYKKKPEGAMEPLELLSNDFWFYQAINNLRGSLKQVLGEKFSVTVGSSFERTGIRFDLLKEERETKNNYWTWLPFANINKKWENELNLTLAYRRTINRPGINHLNPTIDFSDPYNIRFGNDKLEASTSHNIDLVIGKTKLKYFVNFGVGHNIVQDVFSQVRTLVEDGKTQVSWENISGRKEYEISTWDGLTLSKKARVNVSATYIYSVYSDFDKAVRKFRDGGSFTSNVNSNFSITDLWNITTGFTLNRFGNPQGYSRWSAGMNFGVQKRFLKKRLIVTLNTVDPFVNQQRRTFTYGTNFNLESYRLTNTRNFRLTVAYNFVAKPKKKPISLPRNI